MLKSILVKIIIIFILLLFPIYNTYAVQEEMINVSYEQYSKEYKKWLNLSEEEKKR